MKSQDNHTTPAETVSETTVCEKHSRRTPHSGRARGRLGGRPKKLADAKQLELARTLYAGGQTDIATICQTLGISRAILYRALKGFQNDSSVAP